MDHYVCPPPAASMAAPVSLHTAASPVTSTGKRTTSTRGQLRETTKTLQSKRPKDEEENQIQRRKRMSSVWGCPAHSELRKEKRMWEVERAAGGVRR